MCEYPVRLTRNIQTCIIWSFDHIIGSNKLILGASDNLGRLDKGGVNMDVKETKKTFIPGSIIGISTGDKLKNGSITDGIGAILGGTAVLIGMLGGLSSLYLSQITNIAEDLTNETVQNWVKRKLINRPKGKTYDQDQVARILIINSLRKVMDLSQIKKVLDFVNGKLEDKSDDVLHETNLLHYYYQAISLTKENNPREADDYKSIITRVLSEFQEVKPGDKEKLSAALTIMCIAQRANELKKEADKLIEQLS